MTAYKGYRVEIRLPLQYFTNSILVREDGSKAIGDGVTTTFYTPYFPITDSSGNITDDENDVLVYVDSVLLQTSISGEIIGTGDGLTTTFSGTLSNYTVKKGTLSITDGTETFTDNGDGTLTGDLGGSGTINYETGDYSVAFNTAPASGASITADYSYLPFDIVGSEGKVVFDTPPSSGASLSISYYTKTTIGYARSLEYSSDNKADAFEALGSRYPVTIEYGPQEVSITLERAYVDRLFSHIFDAEEPEVEIGIDFDGDGTDDLTVQGQVSRYSVTTSTNDFIIARIEFVGKRV